jgi:hypothetical protein
VKTKTPGADVASWISFAAAAPLRDFAMRRNGSNFATKFDPSSMTVNEALGGDFVRMRGRYQTRTHRTKQPLVGVGLVCAPTGFGMIAVREDLSLMY